MMKFYMVMVRSKDVIQDDGLTTESFLVDEFELKDKEYVFDLVKKALRGKDLYTLTIQELKREVENTHEKVRHLQSKRS